MSNAYDYHYEEEEQEGQEDLPELDPDWVKDLMRLDELKAQKAALEAEIRHINNAAAEVNLFGTFTDSDGTTKVVKIRQDDAAPKLDLASLQKVDPDLAAKVVTFQVDSTRLKEAIKRGYFTNTNAAKCLITGKKAPWVQITTLAKEDNTNE